MKYSLVQNEKVGAFRGGKGQCPLCGESTIAKCGPRVMHHWSHSTLRNCDPWWENETEWHRQWKNNFPKEWQEKIHIDAKTGEKHIADVQTSKGLTIEFQNSPMSIEEMRSREAFYGNMIWIVNGTSFRRNFYILHSLPNPNADFVVDIAFIKVRKDDKGEGFYRHSENTGHGYVEYHDLDEIREEIDGNYSGHHQFDWVKPRTVWYSSRRRVFLDFAEEGIWELQTYDSRGLRCIRKYDREFFIKRATGN